MGRAISMENQLDKLTTKVDALENKLGELEMALDAILDSVPTKKNINILEEEDSGKEKTNNEGNGSSGKQSNKRAGKSKK